MVELTASAKHDPTTKNRKSETRKGINFFRTSQNFGHGKRAKEISRAHGVSKVPLYTK